MTDQTTEPRFWMIWNPQGRTPTMKHWSRTSADNEAARLAKENPAQKFYVLKAVGGAHASAPEPSPIKMRRDDDAGIPF